MMTFILGIGSVLSFILSTLGGGGGSLVMMPLINMTAGPRAVAPLMTVGTLISSVSRIGLFFKDIDFKVTAWFVPASVFGAVIGAYLFASVSASWLQICIAIFIFIAVTVMIVEKKLGKSLIKTKLAHFLPLGFFTAILSGFVGGVGPLMNPFYLGYGLSKEKVVATRAANEMLLHTVKLGSYFYFGLLSRETIVAGSIIGLGAVIGSIIGKKALRMVTENAFYRITVGVMMLSGVMILGKALLAHYMIKVG